MLAVTLASAVTRRAVALPLICLGGRLSVGISQDRARVSGGVTASGKTVKRTGGKSFSARAGGKTAALVQCLQAPDLAGLGKFHTVKAYHVVGLREGIILFLLPKKTSSYFYFPWKIVLLG